MPANQQSIGLARIVRRSPGGLLKHESSIDYAAANNFADFAKDTSGYDYELSRLDASNYLRLGGAWHNPLRTAIPIQIPLNGTLANDMTQTFFIAPADMDVTNIFEIHSTAGSDSAAVTLTVYRDASGQACGAGTALMTGTFNLKGTANTLQTATLAYPPRRYPAGQRPEASTALKQGDRLSISISGDVTALAGLTLLAFAKPGALVPFVGCVLPVAGKVVDRWLYLAALPQKITAIRAYIATTAGTGTITLQLTKDTSTDDPGAGSATLLAAALDVSDTQTTFGTDILTPALTATASRLIMAPGDRIGLDATGTMTGITGVYIQVEFEPRYDGLVEVSLARAANGDQTDMTVFIADRSYRAIAAGNIYHAAVGSAVTGAFTIDKSTAAPGAGTAIHTGFDLNTTIDTVQWAAPTGLQTAIINAGDRIAFKHSGAVGSLAHNASTLVLQPV